MSAAAIFFAAFRNLPETWTAAAADYIGMLATVMNAVVLQDALEKLDVYTRVMSAIDIPQLAEPFIRRRADQASRKEACRHFCRRDRQSLFHDRFGRRVAGAGDRAEVIFKATKVDGIYSADPVKDPTATRFEKITFQEVLEKQLKVMDASAISLCMDNNLPIMVFNMTETGNIVKAVERRSGDRHTCVGNRKRDNGRFLRKRSKL